METNQFPTSLVIHSSIHFKANSYGLDGWRLNKRKTTTEISHVEVNNLSVSLSFEHEDSHRSFVKIIEFEINQAEE